jgi:hypothetical protein
MHPRPFTTALAIPDDYTISLERFEGNTWGHITVHHWTHTVARNLRCDVDAIIAAHGPILAAPTEDCASGPAFVKWRKFMAFIGFGFYRTITTDGMRRSVYARWR